MNDVIAVNRSNKYQAANYKKDIEELIGWHIRQAMASGDLKPVSNPCEIYLEFHESTRRRDVDNIHSSQKFILDALVKNRVLKNDSRRYVKQTHPLVVDDKSDFVRVIIKEMG